MKKPEGSKKLEHLHILVPHAMILNLRKVADKKNINMSNLIRMWLSECIDREEKKQ